MHTLLLNQTFEPLHFIGERKLFKHLIKEKVEVISEWDKKVRWFNGSIYQPATIRLKRHVRWIPKMKNFSFVSVFRRDMYICQYCEILLSANEATIDHVVPTGQGGETSWRNCVTACWKCNNKKGNRTPSEAGFRLIPRVGPVGVNLYCEYLLLRNVHPDWEDYFSNR